MLDVRQKLRVEMSGWRGEMERGRRRNGKREKEKRRGGEMEQCGEKEVEQWDVWY